MGQQRFTVVYAKTEAAPGTDSVPVATDALLLDSFELTADTGFYRRPVNDSLARPMRAGVAVPKTYGMTVKQALRGWPTVMDADTKYPQFHHLLQACGMTGAWAANKWTYQMPAKGEGTKSATIYAHEDGVRYVSTMVRGSAVLTFNPGEPAYAEYSLTGLWSDPTAVAVPTPDYDTGTTGLKDVAPAIVVGAIADFDPFGISPAADTIGHISNVKIDLRNNVQAVQSMTVGSEAVGLVRHLGGHGDAADDGIAVTFDVEQQAAAAADDWWVKWLAQTVDRTAANLHIIVGNAVGNVMTVQLGGIHIVGISKTVLDGGRLGYSVEGRPMGTAASVTEDDLTISIT